MRYGAHAEQVVDVEGDGDGPVVTLVHGGCWRARYDRTLQAAVAADLRARGYRTANVEYRRLDAGGTWPEPLDDVLAAIASARAEVVVGHSAGGHLALLAAAQLKLPTVAQAPVTDLDLAVRLGACAGAAERLVAAGAPSPVDRPVATPHLVLHGDADEHVPVELSRRYVAAAPHATYVELPGCGHLEHLDPSTPAWAEVISWIAALPSGTGSRT